MYMVTRMYIVVHVYTVAQTYMVVHTYMMAHTHNHSMGGVQQDLGKCEVTLFSVASSRLVNDTLSQKINNQSEKQTPQTNKIPNNIQIGNIQIWKHGSDETVQLQKEPGRAWETIFKDLPVDASFKLMIN